MTIRPRAHGKSAFSRDAWLEIDLNAIEHNYYQIKNSLQTSTKFMAVVKSDAYGHGASTIGPLLEACGVDYFGIASVDEGIQLREAKVKAEILILSPTPVWALERALSNNLQITVSSLAQVQEIEKLLKRKHKKAYLQIKINTGMNRNGVKWNKPAKDLIEYILSKPEKLQLMGVYSHLACNGNSFFSQVQADRFRKAISEFEPETLGLKHIAASSAAYNLQFDMVRIGLALYGLGNYHGLQLKPSLSLISRIAQLQEIDADESVGYNLTWKADIDSLIGLLPLGYADGIKRNLSNRIQAIYNSEFVKQVGTISMDQMSFDFTHCASKPKVGDRVILIGSDGGKQIEMREWAQILGTIEYEITCDLRARLPRVYVRN